MCLSVFLCVWGCYLHEMIIFYFCLSGPNFHFKASFHIVLCLEQEHHLPQLINILRPLSCTCAFLKTGKTGYPDGAKLAILVELSNRAFCKRIGTWDEIYWFWTNGGLLFVFFKPFYSTFTFNCHLWAAAILTSLWCLETIGTAGRACQSFFSNSPWSRFTPIHGSPVGVIGCFPDAGSFPSGVTSNERSRFEWGDLPLLSCGVMCLMAYTSFLLSVSNGPLRSLEQAWPH